VADLVKRLRVDSGSSENLVDLSVLRLQRLVDSLEFLLKYEVPQASLLVQLVYKFMELIEQIFLLTLQILELLEFNFILPLHIS
jgi:hypothetical protein